MDRPWRRPESSSSSIRKARPALRSCNRLLNTAADGDIVLVRAGSYLAATPFVVNGKGLTIARDSAAGVQVAPFSIQGVPASSTFALRGLQIIAPSIAPTPPVAAVSAQLCAGRIWIDDCAIQAAAGWYDANAQLASDGGTAIDCLDVVGVVVTRCTVIGGKGAYNVALGTVTAGGSALRGSNGSATAHTTLFEGGDAGIGFTLVGTTFGGHGVDVSGVDGLLAGCVVRGGDATIGWPANTIPGYGLIAAGSTVRVRDTPIDAGVGPIPGVIGPPVFSAQSTITTSSTPAYSLQIANVVRSGSTLKLFSRGPVGGLGLVFVGTAGPALAAPAYEGTFLFNVSAFVGPIVLGTIPFGGNLVTTTTAPPLPAGLDGVVLVLQTAVLPNATLEAATLYVQVGADV
ncbi:MAG: hypothetical protein IPH13_08295 [Planctomycetes bacterium]|nr:hypothetical protein [Planctomycetota bacterium]